MSMGRFGVGLYGGQAKNWPDFIIVHICTTGHEQEPMRS
jgi:hypothetical protein